MPQTPWRRACRRIGKRFPDGLLPEEVAARTLLGADATSPWTDDASATADEPASHSPLRSLLTLEREAAARLRAGAPPGDGWTGWLVEEVGEAGVLRRLPWATHLALPAVWRLWAATDKDDRSEDAAERLDGMVAATLRLVGGAGWLTPQATAAPISDDYRDFLAAVVRKSFGKRAAAVVRPTEDARPADRPSPSHSCDDSLTAVLRRDWSPGAAALALDFASGDCGLRWEVFGRAAAAGDWRTRVLADGRPCDGAEPWEATCRFSDDETDYLELRRVCGGGLVLERQVVLSRTCRALLLVDTLKGIRPEPLEIGWRLPAGDFGKVTANGSAARLTAGADEVRLLAGVPGHGARVRPSAEALELSASRTGRRLVLGVCAHWGRPAIGAGELRPLTVACDRRPVGAEEAIAFRWPVDDRQAVFYRTLAPPRRCTFIGHQTIDECVWGYLDEEGDVQQWLRVQGE